MQSCSLGCCCIYSSILVFKSYHTFFLEIMQRLYNFLLIKSMLMLIYHVGLQGVRNCYACGSPDHLMRDCPVSHQNPMFQPGIHQNFSFFLIFFILIQHLQILKLVNHFRIWSVSWRYARLCTTVLEWLFISSLYSLCKYVQSPFDDAIQSLHGSCFTLCCSSLHCIYGQQPAWPRVGLMRV